MERVTKRITTRGKNKQMLCVIDPHDSGRYFPVVQEKMFNKSEWTNKQIQEWLNVYAHALKKLGDYEDTELMPDEIATLKAELGKVKAERDAAVKDLLYYAGPVCDVCKHVTYKGKEQPTICKKCSRQVDVDNFSTYPHWEWRGLEGRG